MRKRKTIMRKNLTNYLIKEMKRMKKTRTHLCKLKKIFKKKMKMGSTLMRKKC